MFTRALTTAQDVRHQLEIKYESAIASGQYRPFLYPWGTLGAGIMILYLLLDHRQSSILKKCRYLVWGINVIFSIYCILYTRALNPAAAFGVGLISSWSILWTSAITIFSDCQTDFKRIERREQDDDSGKGTNSTEAVSTSIELDFSQDRNASVAASRQKDNVGNGHVGRSKGPARRTGSFAWQSYPTGPFIERLDWVADIFCSFRGMGWNWRIHGLPPPPRSVQDDLRRNEGEEISEDDTHVSRLGMHRYHDRSTLLRVNVKSFIKLYFVLDLLKTLIAHDSYFWGITDGPPPGYLPSVLQRSPVIVKCIRLLISLSAIKYALEFIFTLGPIVFVGILGPELIGARGEPWMYPDHFGSFELVLDKGLAGWWGAWWHQTFRFAFEQPAKRLVEALGLDKKAASTKLLQTTMAFVLSGCLHLSGSYTQIGDTRPLTGPFMFFITQIFGIAFQMMVGMALKSIGISQRIPRSVTRLVNFLYVHVWFYYTAPLLVDDFARGGVWFFEPIPISPLRGLGLGSSKDGWFHWYGRILRWHSGKRWWASGIGL